MSNITLPNCNGASTVAIVIKDFHSGTSKVNEIHQFKGTPSIIGRSSCWIDNAVV